MTISPEKQIEDAKLEIESLERRTDLDADMKRKAIRQGKEQLAEMIAKHSRGELEPFEDDDYDEDYPGIIYFDPTRA